MYMRLMFVSAIVAVTRLRVALAHGGRFAETPLDVRGPDSESGGKDYQDGQPSEQRPSRQTP